MPTSNPNHLQALVHTLRLEASGILGIELVPTGETKSFPVTEAGAHVDLHLPNGLVRSYSLCTPGQTGRYTFGVLLDRNSRGGSRFIHEQLRVGSVIELSAPRNHFKLDESAPASVLVAGGIGITPLYAMLQRLTALGRPVHLVYCARSRREAAYLPQLAALTASHGGLTLHFDEVQGGPPDLRALLAPLAAARPGAHFYSCGPAPMLAAFESTCAGLGIAPAQVHIERFAAAPAPAASAAAAPSADYVVELRKSGRIINVRADQHLLDAVLDAGCHAEYSCREGVCGACETPVIEGDIEHLDSLLTEDEQKANKTMMICVSRSRGGKLVLDL